MAEDPKYVRLANRLSRGMLADVYESQWSIAGLDVRPFPEDMRAARFVRNALSDGKLEPASAAEYEEVTEINEVADEILRQRPDYRETAALFQEAAIQRAAAEQTARVAEARDADEAAEAEADLAAAQEDREARLKEQEEAGLNDDDIERQQAGSTKRSTTATKAKKAKKSTKKKADESSS